MLYVPGDADAAFRHEVDRLVDQAIIETTPDGFDYFVVSSDELTIAPGVAGVTEVTNDAVEVTLIMGSNVDQQVRPTLAEICVEAVVLLDEGQIAVDGLICEAAGRVLLDKSNDHKQLTAMSMQTIFNAYRQSIRSHDKQGQPLETDPLVRAQLRHSLGWTAYMRPINEHGLTAIDTSLADQGVYMPYAESGEVLRGELATSQGRIGAYCYFAVEKKFHGHTCKPCSGEIFRGNSRVTISLDRKVDGYDHHHYHPTCFAETDLSLIDPKTISLQPLPDKLIRFYG